LLRMYMYYDPARSLPPDIKIVHLDESSWQLNKNYVCDVALLGDTREGLAILTSELQSQLTPSLKTAIKTRRSRTEATHRAAREQLESQIATLEPSLPLAPLEAMAAVAKTLPDNIAIVEEAVTTTGTTLERLGAIKNTTGYFGHRGWTLGWGLGVAMGAKLAWPDRPVLALLGEGAALYGIQGLWSAARYQLPVIFLICNNAQYQILKIGAKGLQLPHAINNQFESLDIVGPEVDFLGLARSFGVEAMQVSSASELSDTLASNWNRRTPLLIDVPIQRTTQARLNYG
jgi:benzoylformate decarboxylase